MSEASSDGLSSGLRLHCFCHLRSAAMIKANAVNLCFAFHCFIIFHSVSTYWVSTVCLALNRWWHAAFLEKGMATHSSILAWRIAWTEEPGGLQSMGSQRVGQDWTNNTFIHAASKSLPSWWLGHWIWWKHVGLVKKFVWVFSITSYRKCIFLKNRHFGCLRF